MKTKTWTYIIAATVCIGLSVTFLTAPTPSTAQDGGRATVQLAPEQLITPSEPKRALFFFQNQGFASYYQQVAAADDSVEIVVVSDVDSFLEQAVTRPGWEFVGAFPDPADRSDPGLVDQLSTILDSISANQGGVQLLVAEQASPARPKLGVNSFRTANELQRPPAAPTPPLRLEVWMDDSHLSAIFSANGDYTVLEAVGDQKPLMGLGTLLNENRIDFSSLPPSGTQRGGLLGPPYCCGVVWGACIDTTGNVGACGIPFFGCLINAGGNGCHVFDGICSAPPGGTQFWLCDHTLCTQDFNCGGCVSGPANETCNLTAILIGCKGGTCP